MFLKYRYWWWLLPNLAKSYESLSMQLLWAWEPTFVEMIQAKDPSVVIIAKTWANEVRLDRTLNIITFDQKWVVPRTTKGGGLDKVVVEGDSSTMMLGLKLKE